MSLSLKNKISLVFAGIILLTSSVQIWLVNQRLTSDGTKSATAIVDSTMQAHTSIITGWIAGKKTVLTDTISAFNTQERPISSLAKSMLAGDFDLVYAGTPEGDLITSKPVHNPPGYMPSARPWYKAAKNTNGIALTKPYVDAFTHQLVITLAQTFQAEKNAGVIAADVSLAGVIKEIVSVNNQGMYATLLTSDGLIIANPDSNLTLKPSSKLNSTLTGSLIKSISNNPKLVEMKMNGIDSLVSIRHIEGTNWYFTLVMNKKTAYANVDSTFDFSLIGMIIQLLIVSGFALWFVSKALKPLEDLSQTMTSLSNGDLTKRIRIQSDDEIGQVCKEVNNFIDTLNESINNISGSSVELSEQSKTSYAQATHTTQVVAAQLDDVAQITTAIHEMAATAKEVITHAQHTASAANESNQNCNDGKEVITRNQASIIRLAEQVQDASSSVKELSQNAQSINAIISTISEIAEQTNLLALNAAIEAARAGDQGRGFAVVADEVRVLSQRTHNSTEEIRVMIESLQSNTNNVVDTMQHSQVLANESVEEASNATHALERITNSILDITDMATQISTSAEEQRAVADEISRNVQAVHDVSTQISSDAERSETTAQDLNDIAQHLNTEVIPIKLKI